MKGSLAATLVFTVLLLTALVVPTPVGGREMKIAGDMLHAPLFATLGFLVFGLARDRVPFPKIVTMLMCWGIVAGFGLATEVVQTRVDRGASWHDVWIDACGSLAGILWAQGWTATSRRTRISMFVAGSLALLIGVAGPLLMLTDAILQRFEMPQLASFEHPLELSRWKWRACGVERTHEHATQGQWALRVDLAVGKYPGVTLAYPVSDWSRFRELAIDLHLTNDPPLDLTMKIQDEEHNNEFNDRFNQTVRLSKGDNQICIALSDVTQAPRGRKMDLRQITRLSLFAVSLESPRTLYLDNIRLR